jgi:GNAT superfamily N-acetyltransferase
MDEREIPASAELVKIRVANEDDATSLAALRWEFRSEDDVEKPVVGYEDFVATYTSFFLAGLASGLRTYVVCETDDGIVGHVACQVLPLVPRPCRVDDACGVITDNYVRSSYRNRGIGTAILQRAIEWARERDLETLIVWPSDRARTLYARNGFTDRTEIMEMVLRLGG